MATFARKQFTVTDALGNVLPGATVEVRAETGGSPLASLYSDRAGSTPMTNPTTADGDGFVFFHAAGGAYKIVVTSGSYTRTHRYVAIGLLGEKDNVTSTGTVTPRSLEDRFAERISAKDFEAYGNNSNDDTAALQDWFDYLSSINGAGFLPPGIYKTSGPLTVSTNARFSILGAGGVNLISGIVMDDDFDGLVIAGGGRIHLAGFYIDNPNSPAAGACLKFSGSANTNAYSRIDDVFLRGYDCFKSTGLSTAVISRCDLAPSHTGMDLTTIGDSSITSCSIGPNNGTATAVLVQGNPGGFRFNNNKINGSLGYGISIIAGLTDGNVLIQNNSIEGYESGAFGIITSGTVDFDNFLVTGNQMSGAGHGMLLGTSAEVDRVIVANNIVKVGGNGIEFSGVQTNVICSQNTIIGGGSGTGLIVGASISGAEVGNHISGFTTRKSISSVNMMTAREQLSGNRTYYVRTDGSDSNTGLADTSGGAFLTLQKAINTVGALDIATFDVIIQAGDGTYTGSASVTGPWVGTGTVTLQGNLTTPANCVISLSSGTCILVSGPGARLNAGGFKVVSSSGNGVVCNNGGRLRITGKMEYGACSSASVACSGASQVSLEADYVVSGGGSYHLLSTDGGVLSMTGSPTKTCSGTIAFSTAFALASRMGVITCSGSAYSGGTVTGTRYTADLNSLIQTFGGGASYFPGNAAGSTATGGQYG